jgi:hypothetical protein
MPQKRKAQVPVVELQQEDRHDQKSNNKRSRSTKGKEQQQQYHRLNLDCKQLQEIKKKLKKCTTKELQGITDVVLRSSKRKLHHRKECFVLPTWSLIVNAHNLKKCRSKLKHTKTCVKQAPLCMGGDDKKK